MWKFWKRKKVEEEVEEAEVLGGEGSEDGSDGLEGNGESSEGGAEGEAEGVAGSGVYEDAAENAEENAAWVAKSDEASKGDYEGLSGEASKGEYEGLSGEASKGDYEGLSGEVSKGEYEGLSGEASKGNYEENSGEVSGDGYEEHSGEVSDIEGEELSDDVSGENPEDPATEADSEEAAEAEVAEEKVKKKGFFARLKEGLTKTRDNIVKGIDRLFSGNAIDDDFYEELEEILIMGDIGVNATTAIIERLKEQVKERHLKEPKECKELLIQSIREQMEVGETAYEFEKQQSIIMVIGVNGVGKTTTVGKLAWKLKDDGKKVLIAAADTFRAAAGDQLAEWARRAGVPMIGGKEGADPASVVYDAVNAAKARGVDVLLVDTAGRLHNKKNLMEELRKMNRIIDKEYPDAHRENLIVLDGTTGQNALAQAREFGDVTDLTGIVLTKMDGTAKGGIAVAIQSELGIPVKYIGVGETTQDLQKFDPDDFVRALFDVDLSEDQSELGGD